MIKSIIYVFAFIIFISCKNEPAQTKTAKVEDKPIKLITLDPGHFHAALVQKSMYPEVDSTVYVYSPGGNDLKMHLDRIKNYNSGKDHPTNWNEEVYSGPDYFEKMISDKKGNAVVLSGNNRIKADYIYKSLEAGFHVFADKPMIIHSDDFPKLKSAFDLAKQKGLTLYDIMTERYEAATQLQKLFSQNDTVFGVLKEGSEHEPAISIESVHFLYKYVSGNVLVRPEWFLDTKQQGEGIVDVQTHLVDLVQWMAFPEKIIDTNAIKINTCKRWPTSITLSQYQTITKSNQFADFLKKDIQKDTVLQTYLNGEINYTLMGKHVKTRAIWNYKAPEGTGDTHYSKFTGSRSNLIITQTPQDNNKPTLHIQVNKKSAAILHAIQNQLSNISKEWPGLTVQEEESGYKIIISPSLQEGHEAHFAQVMKKFLDYTLHGNMPVWEVPNTIAKYWLTTTALKKSK